MAILLQKWIFRLGIYAAITNADPESLKSFDALFKRSIWTTCFLKFDENRMVRNILNKLFWGKWSILFEKALTPFWKMFL